ncbi:hypothetical protein [Litchfieldia alkalitelluris]|uniref:hypothetical protein n=1 Tax=Litchfieldia alkalitelluris TaxID=304268 RepID=UPI000996BCC5|nr:hypothetical protein [Litchfieldia alkalitelluris]
MTATNQSFTMIAGDTKNITVNVTNDSGTALNLSGATIKWVMKKRVTSTENDLLKTDITIVGDGVIQIKLVPIDTVSLRGTFYHECEVTDQYGNVSTIFTGNITINPTGV